LVTSGPVWSNLVTGLATATSEEDPVVAIGGTGSGVQRKKVMHQSIDTLSLFRQVTKFSVEIDGPGSVPEVVASAFRSAESGLPVRGVCSSPMDVMSTQTTAAILTPARPQLLGPADPGATADAAMWINKAQRPAAGLSASEPGVSGRGSGVPGSF
jgi:acetolactate synthase I/II/III large subunit